jgi:hypothetical protein
MLLGLSSMPDPTNFRMQRIEKLLHELRYEIERGMLEQDIDETIGFSFYVPLSYTIPDGVVQCEFRTRPTPRYMMEHSEPRLKLVKGGKKDD